MEVAGKDYILSGRASLSASISQAKKLQGKRYWETMATYHFAWWKVSREQPSMLLIDRNTFVFQNYLLIKFFQKESSQISRHKHTVKMIFSTKLPFLFRNRENSREKKEPANVITSQYRWSHHKANTSLSRTLHKFNAQTTGWLHSRTCAAHAGQGQRSPQAQQQQAEAQSYWQEA